jgi:hypothetical protein
LTRIIVKSDGSKASGVAADSKPGASKHEAQSPPGATDGICAPQLEQYFGAGILCTLQKEKRPNFTN